MRKRLVRFHRQRFVLFLLLIVLILPSIKVSAQSPTEVSLSVYPGFTLVNFEKALGYSDEYMEDWDQFYISTALRGFLSTEKNFQFGAEAAWQKLYYAYYIVPYGPSPVYREFNVSTISLMALGRYNLNRFFTVGGAGIHFFDGGISPAIFLEAGYMITAGENLKFPVSFRINPIFADGTPTPISIGAGLSLTIR